MVGGGNPFIKPVGKKETGKGKGTMNYLKLEKGGGYEIEFLVREPKIIKTPFGIKYLYRIKQNGVEIILRATEKLKEDIELYFGLRGHSKIMDKNKFNPNKVKLSVGTFQNYTTYTLIPDLK